MTNENHALSFRYKRFSAEFVVDCILAFWFLLLARFSLSFLRPADIVARNRKSAKIASNVGNNADDAEKAARIGWFVERIAFRLPWRSDCLVQAMAAQDWLNGNQIATTVTIGVRCDDTDSFSSHAWLVHGKDIITGGNIDKFTPIL